MRLLKRRANGSFRLTTFTTSNVMRYAILSHTWDADSLEVTYQEIRRGTGSSKTGYRKIEFCADQAEEDGLEYFWVDSCCIDKSNSSELTEAINSMYRWYSEAAKCYVYLSDVSTDYQHGSSPHQWDQAFSQSRWFQRGWTLQELLAPSSVEFFSRDRQRLGDKGTLQSRISQITGIASQALRGTPMSQFSVEERMSWAADRQTSKEEDKAYSLLGIFEVHMPLIYGEGQRNSFRRLREEIDKSLSFNESEEEISFTVGRMEQFRLGTYYLIHVAAHLIYS
jgi:Heterokaryon incompatibility protein (HET)